MDHQNNKDMPIAITTRRNSIRLKISKDRITKKKSILSTLEITVTEYTGPSVYMLYMVTEERRITIVTEYKFVNVSR